MDSCNNLSTGNTMKLNLGGIENLKFLVQEAKFVRDLKIILLTLFIKHI